VPGCDVLEPAQRGVSILGVAVAVTPADRRSGSPLGWPSAIP
jgi:hypothetical protein